MLERLLLPNSHAIAILIKDHDKVKALFDRFEESTTSSAREKIIQEAMTELKIHASIEEELFYPAVRSHVGKDVMNEADEEHHVARVLVAELDQGRQGDDHRHAKFSVLAESVRHHIKEEEAEMLPKAKQLKMDFMALGKRMLARKAALKTEGVPPDAEHAMVAAAGGSADTPARAARKRRSANRERTRRAAIRRPSARRQSAKRRGRSAAA